MVFHKGSLVFLLLCFVGFVFSQTASSRTLGGRVHIPWLGLGPSCKGCPSHFCDDDPAVIHGYCCGCAKGFDHLPIKCAAYLNCPSNGYSLCDDYEYMMSCCCY